MPLHCYPLSIDQGRRRWLRAVAAGAAAILLPPGVASATPTRALSFHNIHTGESLRRVAYWADGGYDADALKGIDHLLRDHRSDEVAAMDRDLLDLLYALGTRFGGEPVFHVISGYRSPTTNARLRAQGARVAKNSLHIRGKAIDIRVPGVPLADLKKAAVALKGGGVGFYPKSGFIHVDTGRVRYW